MSAEEIFALKVQGFNEEFGRQCQVRHDMGAEKYGPVKFMEVDSLNEAAEELIDFANYIRYTYIKVRLLQDALARQANPEDNGFKKAGGL